MEIIASDKCQVVSNGLIFQETISYEEWSNLGKTLQQINGSIQWWIGDWLNFGERKWGEMYTQAVDSTGLDIQTLMNYKSVAKAVKLPTRVDSMPWSAHREVAYLETEEQRELLAAGGTTREIKERVKEIKRLPAPPMPQGKYNVIYADPPWRYDFSETESRSIEAHYESMDQEQLKNLPIPEGDILFIWATAPKLREALEVLAAWGYEYKTNAVWDKELIGMGYWFRGQHELLLVGVKGDISPPVENVRASSVYRARRTEHSKKPDYFYELIESYFPGQRYLELFARHNRENWSSWGNDPRL